MARSDIRRVPYSRLCGRQRRAEVLAHRIEQRGPYPVDLGERASSGGRLLETLLAQDDGGLCGECLRDPKILRSK